MNLTNKQVTFHKPKHVSDALNEGIRALAERYDGRIGAASEHCLDRVMGLTEARLTRSRGNNRPRSTRDGSSFITLLWVLLVDGIRPHRPPEVSREWLTGVLEATDLFEDKLTDEHLPQVIALFTNSLQYEPHVPSLDDTTITQTLTQVWSQAQSTAGDNTRQIPVFNRLFLGRDKDINRLHERLGIEHPSSRQSLTIVRGWPGVGKTALINALLHDEQVQQAFADGVLWASFGEHGDVQATFKTWAREIGAGHLLPLQDMQALQAGLRAALGGRDILIVADDVWDKQQGQYIKSAVDLSANTLLMTTRFTELAEYLQDKQEDTYVLEPLEEPYAIDLLRELAPVPVQTHRERIPDLTRAVENLPLALRVAGPLLKHYHDMGFDIDGLIDEFETNYMRLLDSQAPADRFDERTGKTPTIELLFKRSVDTLPFEARLAFAALGVFEHKPATFAFEALEQVWTMGEKPEALVTAIVGRGLMEPTSDKRFHIHQTLHMYANKLLDDYDSGQYI